MTCTKCDLYKEAKTNCMPPDGDLQTAEILFVGEAPGYDEDLTGLPFVGDSGKLLRKAIEINNIKNYIIINTVRCRPPGNRNPTPKEIKACSSYFYDDLQKMPNLKLIIPVGNIALRMIIGRQGITSLSGKELTWKNWKLMPLIHPASILYARNTNKLDEFNSHVSRIPAILNNNLIVGDFGKWSKINSLQEWKALKQAIYKKGYFIYDLETTGLNPFRDDQYIKLISFSINDKEAFALVFENWNENEWTEILNDLRDIFEDTQIGKVGQNHQFDDMWLRAISNIKVHGVTGDTKLSQYTLYPNRSNHLKDIAWEIGLGGYEKSLSVAVQDASGDELIEYGCKDSIVTHRAHNLHKKAFISEPELYNGYRNLLVPVSSVLSTMQYNGIKVNPPRLQTSYMQTMRIINEVLENIKQYPTVKKYERKNKVEFNPNSHVQLRELFFSPAYENLEPTKKTKKTKQPSADKEVLEYHKDYNKLANLLYTYSQYNAMQKFCNEIKDNITPDKRIHTTYWLTETRSGRSSSRQPNLQNLAKGKKDLVGLRKIFVADKDYILVECDYSQMELRCMAEEANDEVLAKAILSGDVHRATAAFVLNKASKLVTEDERRNIGKVMNFQIIYGATEYGVARVMKCDLITAKNYLHNYLSNYFKTKEWMDKTTEFVKTNGYVTIRSGFKKYFPNYQNLNDHEIRSAINIPIQGLAGHILFMALIAVDKFLETNKLKSFLSLEIHDSIILNIHKTEMRIIPIIKNIMEVCHLDYMPDFKIPLKVDIKMGENLSDMEDWKGV